jgi:DNA-binding MarR family transcriptional regulator
LNDIGIIIKKIQENLDKRFNKQLQQFGLTISQFRVMFFVKENNNRKISYKDIEKHLEVSQPTIVGLIKRLEKKDFLKVYKDTNDCRVKNVILTEKAYSFFENGEDFKNEIENLITKNLSFDEKKELYRILQIINKNVSK